MEASQQKPAQASAPAAGAPASPSPPSTPAQTPPAAREDDVERYGVAGWRERIRRFEGVSEHAIAGALHGLEEDATVSEQEVRDRLDAFLKRKGTEDS